MSNFLSAAGPLFGPDFVVVTVNDETGTAYSVEVYPDASNEDLRAAGLPPQYYWQPSRVYLAKKQDSPQDFAFGMTVFKGLMTEETSVGVSAAQTSGGDVETGGGFATFTTTFAVPDSVIANAVKVLRAGSHPAPAPRLAKLFFNYGAQEPDPLLGIVPIIENNVTIEVPDLVAASAGTKSPMFISAQGSGKGSIEAHGDSSFLVTCNELAAGAIAGSLKAGVSPFTVHCNLKEQMYIHACQITVHADADKSYEQFSAALSVGGFLGIDSATLDYAYSNMLTSGAITTEMQMDEADISPELKQWIEKNVDDMRKAAFDAIKSEIFDWKPADQAPATADRSLFSSIFGGAAVTLKQNYQHRGLSFPQTLKLDTSIAVNSTVSGTLDDLLPAVKANPDRYLAIVDVGEFFKKIQVVGSSAVNFDEKLADGTALHDPIQSIQLEVSYPDFDNPEANGQVNLVTDAQGFHYTVAKTDPNAGAELAMWTKDNPADLVNIAFLRLAADSKEWPADQVKLTKTLVYDGDDPRVELSNGGTTMVIEQTGPFHAPRMTVDEVGYVFVRFMLDINPPKDNVTMTLTTTLGSRTDTLTITRENQKNILWEIFSDKYINETSFTYTLQVEVTGPNFTDPPVTWQTDAPVTVALPTGRVKYVNPLKITLPPAPADKVDTINNYIKAFQAS
ncbi:hypothetical protein [Kitasatospora mediocidica]|uniref:hypothetical protein n=1 Tax=Kitasatospora mediocidica TaxID=58352 RepID=UPI000565CA48|nr:hypothetical protein [Kitasatospora mediocidica]